MGKSETFCIIPASNPPPTHLSSLDFGTGVNLTIRNATTALIEYITKAQKQMTPIVLISEMEIYETILSKTKAGMNSINTISEHALAAVTPNKPFLVKKKPVPIIMYILITGLTAE